MKAAGWVVFLLLMSVTARADEAELRSLARIHQEIGHVLKLVETIQQEVSVDPDAPIRFRYPALKARLQQLRLDIQGHIDWVQSQPKLERFDVE